VRLSKLLSYALRHHPEALGVELDAHGWTSVDSLLAGLAKHGEAVSREELTEIVRTNTKQRFAVSEDGARIRANQGHSAAVDLGLPPKAPPTRLYHGTVARFLASIRSSGLLRGSRTHVHLSADEETARTVAGRRKGPAVILVVRAGEMHRAGNAFYQAENGVWLTEQVPVQYLDFPGD
jgi:putative RNA 2'-phosphotransferase